MSERVAVKKVVQFARREYKEKRPISVKVARTKPEIIFSKGFLSSTKIKKKRLSNLIVIAEYRTHYRIYSFTKTARLLGAENIDSTPEFKKKLTKSEKNDLFTSKAYEKIKPEY